MIGGLVLHDGHPALAIHLARVDDNERVTFRTRGLSANTIADAIAELRLMALGSRTGKPIIHSWASPSMTYSDADWERHREEYEAEFGLVGFPCVEVYHLKYGEGGRTSMHVHRVHLRIDSDGRVASTSHSAARQEKVSRISEFLAGERFTSGVFNKSVISRLREEGRPEIADAMVRAGLDKTTAAASPTSVERATAERLQDLSVDEVWRRCAAAWRRSDTGPAFSAALADSGLRLAQGEKCPVVVSPAGVTHPLLRAINKGGERQSGQAIRKADLTARLRGMVLPSARELLPLAGFVAGVFSITHLDRVPVSAPRQPETMTDGEVPATGAVDHTPELTFEQEAALVELDDALHSAAAGRAREIRLQIEDEIVKEVRKRRQHEALRLRIAGEKAAWDLAGIGVPNWRDRYRAELAGLPAQYGPHLKWVEQLDAERRRVTLKSGAILTLAPDRTWTAQSSNADVIPFMISHAKERGWKTITVNGKPEWRAKMAQEATRAGLVVMDADLQNIVADERLHIHQEALVDAWLQARAALARCTTETRQQALERLMGVLGQIAEDETDLVGRVIDPDRQEALAKDIIRYRHMTQDQAQELAAGPSSPGSPFRGG
ncbi:LPD7 domain-containing protein [Devosia salina]|uniref:Large polyvalent protein-associated domain-containing protein n=1 Tax=Devosia salina TaxID=2860336 RepID=A0ABX8WC84_9HYPH|nr:LPD7 domain-containing protein [Devosia salina]QYO76540.1 hypothetical protein K1X15_18430 [Devosia salina]